jgi:hypothetical protein
MTFFRTTLLLTIGILASTPVLTSAQGLGGGTGNRIEGNFKFLPIPYVNYNRSVGLQGGALPIAMFNPVKSDTVSPSSMAGLFGMYSTNKTWFVMGFGRVYLAQDRWRLSAAAGAGNYNFQFFVDVPIEGWIPYSSRMGFGSIHLQRKIYDKLYGGISYIYLDFETSLEVLPDTAVSQSLNGVGADLSIDLRSSVYYPRNGFTTSVKLNTYPSALGNDTTSAKLQFEHDHFISLRDDTDVLAIQAFAGFGLGDLSFNQQFIVGQGKKMPGYTQGEYRGDNMLVFQGEYRWNFRPRLGLIGFVAMATVFGSINDDDNGKPLPSMGTGFRFTVDTETRMNVGMDIAVAPDDWGIYFRIGESF